MFDWFWEFLYGISKSLLRLIDGVIACSNKLCGIEEITVDGEQTDFLTYIFNSDGIRLAFRVSAMVATVIIVFFAIFAILRNIAKERPNETPAQIGVKTAKSILMFMFVPFCMAVFTFAVNIFVQALYQATLNGSSDGIGRYLFSAFAEDAYYSGYNADYVIHTSSFNYYSTSDVEAICDISDFNFIFSWIAGFAILYCLTIAVLLFVERAISIAILYICAPISIASSILDDGARFKLWRDQVLVKYITGYGTIIAINVYALIIGLISDSSVVFFENSFLNNLMKIAIILGGAFSMQKICAVIGNLVSAGAGSNEMRETQMAADRMGGFAMGALKTAGSVAMSPFKAIRGAVNFGKDSSHYGFGSTIANRLGFKTAKDYKDDKSGGGGKEDNESSENANNETTKYDTGINAINNALTGNNDTSSSSNNSNNSNANNNNGNKQGQSMINNAIVGDLSNNNQQNNGGNEE